MYVVICISDAEGTFSPGVIYVDIIHSFCSIMALADQDLVVIDRHLAGAVGLLGEILSCRERQVLAD